MHAMLKMLVLIHLARITITITTTTKTIPPSSTLDRTTLSVLYLTDTPLTRATTKLLSTFINSVSNSTGTDRKVELKTTVLPSNATNMLPVLRILNNSLSWGETGIIILDVQESGLQSLSLFSSFGVVFDIRTRPVDETKIYSNTLTAKPSLTRLHDAVKQIFGEIGWTKMAELECPSLDQHGGGIDATKRALDTIKQNSFTFIFVKCLENLDIILKYATEIELTGNEFRWVFPGIAKLHGIAGYLPKNVIGIDLLGSLQRHDSVANTGDLLFLRDVLKVLEIILVKNSETLRGENEWSSTRFKKALRSYIIGRTFSGYTGDVIFDEKGRRSGEHYEIFELITFNGRHQWLPIGSLEQGNIKILFNQWRLDKHPSDEIPVLRVVTVFKYPWAFFTTQKYPEPGGKCLVGRPCRKYPNATDHLTTEEYCCTGMITELLTQLESDVGFRGELHIVKDGKFGSNDPKTHKWNGMIGELTRGEADMALSSLTITAKRSKVVDFTYPFLDAAVGILVSTEPAVHSLWEFVFLDTFSGSLWLTLFATVQIVIMVIWLAERMRRRRRFVNDPYKRDNSISYAEIINYTYSLVFQKASEEVGPSTLGGRTVAALFAFCTIIACSSFTANLAAIQVSERAGISITGIHDSKFQNPSSDFKFGTIADSSSHDFFKDSEDPVFQRIYQHLKKNLVTTSQAGADNVRSRKWTAHIDDIPELQYFVSQQTNCKLTIKGAPFFFSGYAIGLPKNSTWNNLLSLALTKLVRNGFISAVQSKWIISDCSQSSQHNIEKMGVNDIGGAFLIVAFGCVASLVFLGLEFAVWKTMKLISKEDEGCGGEHQKLKRSHTLTTLAKAFVILDIQQAGKPANMTQEGTVLRNFRTFTPIQRQDHSDTRQNGNVGHTNKLWSCPDME